MGISRRGALALSAAVAGGGAAWAQQALPTIRIGVLSDMSGPYRDISGPGCVSAARQAVQDFGTAAGFNVEILQADHQNKADVGAAIVRLAAMALAALPLFAGFLLILVDDRRRGLQDRLARTVVVYAPDARRVS